MLSKAKVKYLSSLKSKKFRQKYNNFVAEGDKIAIEILKNAQNSTAVFTTEIEAIYGLSEWIENNTSLLQPFQAITTEVDKVTLQKISSLQTPNQALIVLKTFDYSLDKAVIQSDFTLLLDEIQDPGNLGTILRIADWFGIKNIICSKDCADLYNPKTIQATMGAFLRVKIFREDLTEFCATFKELPVYGAVLGGSNLFQTQLEKKALIVIGNEGKGISESMLQLLTHRIEIPANGQAESLNAAIATGIICAAFRNL